jgi:dTMP kinase
VLCDRYFYSTLAFQGYGRGLDIGTIASLNTLAVEGTIPDLVILLDLDPAEGLARTRTRGRGSGGDAFEGENLSFHKALRDGFLELATKQPEPFLVIDASLPPAEVLDQSIQALQRVLKARSQANR